LGTVYFIFIGVLASSGKYWKETRTFALTTLRDLGFGRKSLEARIVEEIESFLQIIDDTDGQPFNIHASAQISVSNVVCSVIFGKRFMYDDDKFKKLLSLLDEGNRINVFTGPVSFLPFLEYLPGDPFHFKDIDVNFRKPLSDRCDNNTIMDFALP